MAENKPRVSPWDTSAPSSFVKDSRFAALKSGKSFSQTGTEQIARRTRATGKNPGTLSFMAKDPVSRQHTSAYSRKKAAE